MDFKDFHPDYDITTSSADDGRTEVVITNKNGRSGASETFTAEQMEDGTAEAFVSDLIQKGII